MMEKIKDLVGKKNILNIIVIALVTISFVFKITGISKNLSYWNDESHVALLSRGLLEYGVPQTANGYSTGPYQILQYVVTAFSMSIFGITEWTARLPSVVASTALVIFGVLLSKKMIGEKVSFVVLILLAFSQIQLAWGTQLRPYVWLELFTLLVVYFEYEYLNNHNKIFDRNLGFAVTLSLIAALFHGTGLLNLVIVLVGIICKAIELKKYSFLFAIPLFLVVIGLLFYTSFSGNMDAIWSTLFKVYFSPLHYRIFLTHNYLWLLIGSFIGFVTLFKSNRELALLLGGSIVFIFAIAIFKINPNYIRYSLPAFPLMYILFANGMVSVLEKITKKEFLSYLLIILVLALLSRTGKIIIWPKYYYSINSDMTENPIVDYKQAFENIKHLIKDKQDTLIIDAWNDRVPWYLPNQEFVVTNNSVKGIDPVFGEKFIGSIDEVKNEIASHKTGVVIVEDWQSFMSEEIKEYVRKNLKYEFTVQDLPYNENDHWGISVYSWGI